MLICSIHTSLRIISAELNKFLHNKHNCDSPQGSQQNMASNLGTSVTSIHVLLSKSSCFFFFNMFWILLPFLLLPFHLSLFVLVIFIAGVFQSTSRLWLTITYVTAVYYVPWKCRNLLLQSSLYWLRFEHFHIILLTENMIVPFGLINIHVSFPHILTKSCFAFQHFSMFVIVEGI